MKGKLAVMAAGIALSATAFAQTRGVSDTEITLGMVTDLSGPIANYGKESRNAGILAVEEINARGGIHGRKLKFLVEDHGYDPRKSVLATQKLVTQGNGIFAMVGTLGTATNLAALPMLLDNKVFSFLPQGGARELYDPPHMFKVGLAPSYVEMSATTTAYMMGKKKYEKPCILYQDDDFGREVLDGVSRYLDQSGKPLVEKVSYKRGAVDFSSQMARMKSAGCDFVFSATTMREYIASVQEANKIGFKPDFMGTAANYAPQIHSIGGKLMEGVYSSTFILLPYPDDANPGVRDFVARYRKRFNNEDPSLYSMYTYYGITTFARLAEKTGRNLTAETFNATMESTKLPSDELGNPPFSVSRNNRLGIDKVRVVQIQNGKWVPITDFLEPVKLK